MSNDKERHALLMKGRLLFDSCSPENDYACVIGYINHNAALGGWRAEVMGEFVDWLHQQRDTEARQSAHAMAILQQLEDNAE